MTVVSFSMAYRSFRGGSGRLHTRLDTPPLINRRHPDSCIALRVSVFDYYGWFTGAFEPVANAGSGEVKIRQARLILDPMRRMAVAREIIRGTLFNIMEGLRYYAYRGAEDLKPAIE